MNLLEDNFREIYHTIKFPSFHSSPLVANLTGTRIYDSRYGWGRLWCWFYKALDFITDYPWQNRKLSHALQRIHTLFVKTLDTLVPHLNTYKEYLNKHGKGYVVCEDLYVEARDQITQWNQATKPFAKLLKKVRADNNFIKLFRTTLDSKTSEIKSLRSIQKMIDLEGWCGSPLPLFAIKRILRNIPLNTIDQKEISKWIGKINKYDIPIETVHKALQAVANFYAPKNTTKTIIHESLASLELLLEEKGCNTFQQNDQKHLKWRQNLQTGNSINIHQSVITLDKEIFPKLSGSDQTRAYTIQGMENRVALIAHNRCILPLRNLRMRQEKTLGIQSAQFFEISLNGKIALMQRMKKANELKWITNSNVVSPEDAPLVKAITRLIRELIEQNVTPSNLSSTVMFDENFQFKCIKPTTIVPFDFNAVEDFLYACSAGNPHIFQALMTQTRLNTHSVAKFYKEVVSNTLKDEKITTSDLAAIYKIGEPKVVDRAAILAEQVRSEKKQCLLKLREMHPEWYSDQLNTQANENILKQYLNQKRCSVFEV